MTPQDYGSGSSSYLTPWTPSWEPPHGVWLRRARYRRIPGERGHWCSQATGERQPSCSSRGNSEHTKSFRRFDRSHISSWLPDTSSRAFGLLAADTSEVADLGHLGRCNTACMSIPNTAQNQSLVVRLVDLCLWGSQV